MLTANIGKDESYEISFNREGIDFYSYLDDPAKIKARELFYKHYDDLKKSGYLVSWLYGNIDGSVICVLARKPNELPNELGEYKFYFLMYKL